MKFGFIGALVLAHPVCMAQVVVSVLDLQLAQGVYVANAVGLQGSQANVLAPSLLATLVDSAATSITGISLRPTSGTATIPVSLLSSQKSGSATPASATFVVPAGVPLGSTQLIWQIGGGQYRSISVTVQPSNFAIEGGRPDTLALPVRPGQIETLTGTGLGNGNTVTVTVGGVAATVLSAGHGTRPGYDQIQFTVPAGVTGCFVPVWVTVGNRNSFATISVTADGSPCQTPFALPKTDLIALDKGGSVAVGEISLSSSLLAPDAGSASRQESASINFSHWSAGGLSGVIPAVQGAGCSAGARAFLVSGFTGLLVNPLFGIPIYNPFPPPPPDPDPGPGIKLQNGSVIVSLEESSPGSGYYQANLPPAQDGTLAAPPAPVLPPGKWTLTTPGSADLPALSFAFTIRPPLTLGGGSPLTLRRDRDQTLTWNAMDFDPASTVTLSLSSGSSSVSCLAPASSGTITIPAALLAGFAGSSIGNVYASVLPGPGSVPSTVLKTTKGDSLLLFVSYSAGDTRPVDFQ